MKLLRKKIPLFNNSPKLAAFLSISFTVLFFSFVLFTFTYLLTGQETVKAQVVDWVPHTGKSVLEVHIANNGMVFLQGARVESISGTTIVVSTSWNSIKLLWTIHTNASYFGPRNLGTEFLDSKGKRIYIGDIREGNLVSVSGTFDISRSELTLKADTVRL